MAVTLWLSVVVIDLTSTSGGLDLLAHAYLLITATYVFICVKFAWLVLTAEFFNKFSQSMLSFNLTLYVYLSTMPSVKEDLYRFMYGRRVDMKACSDSV